MKNRRSTYRHRLLALIGLTSWLLLASISAQANSLSLQLTDLVNQADNLDLQLASTSITTENSCSELAMANTSIGDLTQSIENVIAGLTAPLSLTTEDLTSLDDLSNLSKSMASSIKNMSMDINSIADLAKLFEYQASLSAMLKLSDDIGTMADRILEMAKELQVDLIVMGTHGKTGLAQALMGSVTEKVARLAPCPVLVTRDAMERSTA